MSSTDRSPEAPDPAAEPESGLHARLLRVPLRIARRLVVAGVGLTLLVLGAVLLFVPGPGLLVLGLGLAVLGAEFAWARRWIRELRALATENGVPIPDGSDDRPRDAEPPPSRAGGPGSPRG